MLLFKSSTARQKQLAPSENIIELLFLGICHQNAVQLRGKKLHAVMMVLRKMILNACKRRSSSEFPNRYSSN
jgi:hypothetical protein